MKLFWKNKREIEMNDVIDYLKRFDDEALPKIMFAVRLSREADKEIREVHEINAENWYRSKMLELVDEEVMNDEN